mgnify:CR=1 FL=1
MAVDASMEERMRRAVRDAGVAVSISDLVRRAVEEWLAKRGL